MTFSSLRILADENISPKVVPFLREQKLDVLDTKEELCPGHAPASRAVSVTGESRGAAMRSCIFAVVFAVSFPHCTATAAQPEAIVLYVAANGNDAWSGRLAAPNAGKTDGPFATITRARDAIRELKRTGRLDESVTVQIRGGTYLIDRPITLTPDDSGAEGRPVTYAAYPGEQPVLCGGRLITGWRPHKDGIYVADLPDARAGGWYFRQLFADGKRQVRARYPNVHLTDPLRKGFLYCHGIGGFGESVGCIHNVGDWMDYEVEVPADGEYTVWMYYAALNKPHGNTDMADRTSLTVEGGEPVMLMNLPDTGGVERDEVGSFSRHQAHPRQPHNSLAKPQRRRPELRRVRPLRRPQVGAQGRRARSARARRASHHRASREVRRVPRPSTAYQWLRRQQDLHRL